MKKLRVLVLYLSILRAFITLKFEEISAKGKPIKFISILVSAVFFIVLIKLTPYYRDYTTSKKEYQSVFHTNYPLKHEKFAQYFYNNHEIINDYFNEPRVIKYSNDIDAFDHYLTYFNEYYDFYSDTQIESLYSPIYNALEKIELTDEILTNKQLLTPSTHIKLLGIFGGLDRSEKEKQSTRLLTALNNRENYFKEKYGKDFKDHPTIAQLYDFARFEFVALDHGLLRLDVVKEQWEQSTTSNKKRLLSQMAFNDESNDWVKMLLTKKQSKEITRSILEFLADHAKNAEDNQKIVLDFILSNQRYPYIKIANKYFGYEVVAEYLSINESQ